MRLARVEVGVEREAGDIVVAVVVERAGDQAW
jgi:hypothetical protein